ncbi:MAG: YfhO family protein [Clostridium sp.]|uniref:YfhO family protein n=1 Tax=Clostridium sp. TaxID=1506 RepID=UPI002A74BFF9|nr:YfhO family protein [Clostridium sp.]MDY2630742.1 YfhO family protein [Clostridium sp.]
MKKVCKDLGVSLGIAFMTFYLMYLIKGSILSSDLYNQGIDFIEYFKNYLNIFSKDWVYNWNIALGDSTYALTIYYLLSPFNIILKLFKNVPIIILLPMFMTLKMMFMSYFASIYFEKVTSKSFRWIGTLIYISSYYIIVYGNYQIMWLDTFILLPLLLLGIEKVIGENKKLFYIVALFFFISSDYYLAAILIPHIAIYAIIRFIIIKGYKGIFKFIFDMIITSLLSVLLSSFVLIPAILLMYNSSKDVGNTIQFGHNIKNVISFFTQNYVGFTMSPSNTNITLIGMITFIPWIIFGKEKIKKLYYVHIFLLILAVFSDKLSYLLNLGYMPAGGNYRYNLFLNIYIALILFEVIKELLYDKNKMLKISILAMGLVDIIILLSSYQSKSKKVILINLALIVIYCIFLFFIKLDKNKIIYLLTIFILFEVIANLYYIFKPRNEVQNEVRIRYSNVLEYMKDNYEADNRVEIRDTYWSWNIYLASNISGVSGYHSLINGSYKDMSNVFATTNKNTIRNEFKGRNIISSLVSTKYYLTEFKYCPYRNSELIDEAYGYYIYKVDNEDFKFYPLDTIVTGELPPSVIEKDNMLYKYLYVDEGEDNYLQNIENLNLNKNNITIEDVTSKEIKIIKSGDYYIKVPKDTEISNISFKVNGNIVGESTTFPNLRAEELDYNEIYIGYLNLGDILELPDNIVNVAQLVSIDGSYIVDNDNSQYINIDNIEKSNTGLKANIELKEDGLVFLPIAYDDNWQIEVNDTPVEYYKVNGGFIALKLDSGINNINMIYSFNIMYISVVISFLTFLCIIIFYIWRRRKWNQNAKL